MKKAAVVGAAGYAGVELVRILLCHPEFELTCITSTSDAGTCIADLYPALLGRCDLVFEAHDAQAVAEKADIAFLAVPHTASLAMTPQLVERGVQVVDLSADYRIADPVEACVNSAKVQLAALEILLKDGAARALDTIAKANVPYKSKDAYFRAVDAFDQTETLYGQF